jgi:aspartyl-tRNA(Asn)/glutamyl-tRNA(Gln) amidotransferase subunit A
VAELRADPADLSLLEAAGELRARRLSAVELLAACERRIEARNGGQPSFDGAPDAVNAWVRLYPELAAEQARAADDRLAREGGAAPLVCGVPVGLKDLYAVAGLPLTASSRMLENNVAEADCEVWRRLRERGMVLLGHTHTHEFACGGTTDQVGNPWALDRVAGGSSGGSGAALAARMTPAALGSDTCGSLRIPATCCGISTIKPTHGRVPLAGVIPLAPSLDHAGPMARTVADSAALLMAMAEDGAEPSAHMPPPRPLGPLPTSAQRGPKPLAGLTIALTDRPANANTEARIMAGLDTARRACEELGARVVELEAPKLLEWDDLSWIFLTEIWGDHAQYADREELYRPSIRQVVQASRNFTDAQRYIATQALRARAAAAWEAWYAEHGVDLVLEPTLPIDAPVRGPGYDATHTAGAGDPLIELTVLWDMVGFPVAALPVPDGDRIPAGVSFVAPRGGEANVAQAAIDLQEHALGLPSWPA